MSEPQIELCDVGPRDGLQNLGVVLPVAVRAELVERLAAAGLRRIEVTSFVSPRRVPEMAGAEDVVAAVERVPDVLYSGLVLNRRGYERFRETGLDEVHVAVACTDTFNERNQGVPVQQSLTDATRITRLALADGRRTVVTLAVAFGCPFEGEVEAARVLELASAAAEAGAAAIMLADTIGVATPRDVRELVGETARLGIPVGVHLHDTRNTGIANALAAISAGATILDASVGGIGGCPFAPNASGNVATEDLLYVLDREGVATGVSLASVLDVAAWLEGAIGRPLESHLHRAGDFAVAV